MPIMSYQQIRPDLKTGDLVLFSGKGGVSEWIKWFTRSDWSHMGMVLKLDEWDMVLLWESTTLNNLPDVERQVPIRGVQLVGLRERINTYEGDKIAIRPLSKKLSRPQQTALGNFRSSVAGRPYEQDKLELLGAAADFLVPDNCEDLSSIFCSELVAEAYQVLGILDATKPSNEYVPNDFSTRAKERPKMLRGFKLGDEIELAG